MRTIYHRLYKLKVCIQISHNVNVTYREENGLFGRIENMFSLFREWWILRRLRILSQEGDIEQISRDVINSDCGVQKDIFLRDIAKKRLIFFPRSKESQNKRIRKDKKILEISKVRDVPFVKEMSLAEFTDTLDSSKAIEKLLGKTISQEIRSLRKDSSLEDELKIHMILQITGKGASFTFPVACSEFVSTHYLFFASVVAILVALASWSPIVKEWVAGL